MHVSVVNKTHVIWSSLTDGDKSFAEDASLWGTLEANHSEVSPLAKVAQPNLL